MKIVFQIYTIAILVIATTMGYGQTTLNDFTVIALSNEENGSMTSTFIKSETNLIWKQDKNSVIQEVTFSIQNTTGTWDEATSIGEVIISSLLNGHEVIFTLIGNVNGITAALVMTNEQSDADTQTLDFSIDTITHN